jgi:hypothetical protein
MSIRVAVLVIRWIYVTPSAMPGNTGGYRRKAWPSWFVRSGSAGECSGGLRWDERSSVLVVLLLSPVVTSVAGRNNCGCLDDLFYLCTGVADALGNSG